MITGAAALRRAMLTIAATALLAACGPGGAAPANTRLRLAPESTPRPGTAQPVEPATVYYTNCTAARAAGAAPLHRNDPGYRAGLDRDNDGIACE